MRKILLLFAFSILTIALCLSLGSCKKDCEHVYDNDCDTQCNECDEERSITHAMLEADCVTPSVCSVCGFVEGNALGHKWEAATCTSPKRCSECGAINGKATDHLMTDATCLLPSVCEYCGKSEGEALGHIPASEDGDCTTHIPCLRCGDVAVPGEGDHIDRDTDGKCDRAGCGKSVDTGSADGDGENEPEDNNGGFDFPMDENP